MCPRYILSDNGTEFKNQLMNDILQQLGINHTFSTPYHCQSNGTLKGFHMYLKPTLKKLCENDPDNLDQYLNQVLSSYHVTPHLAIGETPFFFVYVKDPNLPLHELLESMQCFHGNPDSGHLNPEMHCLALAIAKKTLDGNRFRNAQKTTDHLAPNFQVGDRVYFKNKQPSKWYLKWRAKYRIVHIECDGHYLPIENQATGKTQSCNVKDVMHEPPVELWNLAEQGNS